MRRARLYNVIAQQVCETGRRTKNSTRRTSSVGLPLVEVMARSKSQAISRAKKIWRGRGKLDRKCKLYPSAGEQ